MASPYDTIEERDYMENIIDELNHTNSSKSFRLELIKWETHSTPSIGEYSQQVVNKTIGDEYNIFVGLLWQRFGTPTPNAGSGTEEEFDRAIDRYRSNPQDVKILFYFKQDPILPNQIDVEQINKINEFREKLKELGVMYWEYQGLENFGAFIRIHLSKIINELESNTNEGRGLSKEPSPYESQIKNSRDEIILDEDLGIYEYLEIAQDSLEDASESLNRMNEIITIEGNKITERTKEIRQLNSTTQNKAKRKIINRIPYNLDNLSDGINRELPIFNEKFVNFVDSTSKLISMMGELGVDLPPYNRSMC